LLDDTQVEALRQQLCDRFTAAELIEILDISTFYVVNAFLEEVLETDWSEHL